METTANLDPAIAHRDPETMGGVLCFTGTRVPVRILFDFLENGDNVERFLRNYPRVRREQVLAILELSADSIAGSLESKALTNA